MPALDLVSGIIRRIGMRTPSRNTKRVLSKLAEGEIKRVRSEEDQGPQSRFVVADQLRDLLNREDTPAAARVNAARTLAEIEGLIGRHQTAPEKGTTTPLSSLSRDQLNDELLRLRTLFDLGLVR